MKYLKLKNNVIVIMGQAPKGTECNFDGQGVPFVKAGEFGIKKPIIREWTTNPLKFANEDDILICVVGATAGKLNLGINAAIGRSVAAIRCKERIYNKYLYYYLQPWILRLRAKSQGSAIGVITKDMLYDLEILLPEYSDQQKIVQVLDKAQELIDKRKEQIAACDELVKSLFYHMFGDPVKNDRGWGMDYMENVAPSIQYSGEFSGKVWLLNLDKVESDSGKILEYNYVDILEVGNSTCIFNEENVLYSKLRPYLNKVVIPYSKGYATSELVPLKPKKNVLNRIFLAQLLRSHSFVRYISERVAGAKMPRVSMSDFRAYNVILPPIDLQNKFAKQVEKIEQQKQLLEQSLAELETNFNSLMQRAFKGELF